MKSERLPYILREVARAEDDIRNYEKDIQDEEFKYLKLFRILIDEFSEQFNEKHLRYEREIREKYESRQNDVEIDRVLKNRVAAKAYDILSDNKFQDEIIEKEIDFKILLEERLESIQNELDILGKDSNVYKREKQLNDLYKKQQLERILLEDELKRQRSMLADFEVEVKHHRHNIGELYNVIDEIHRLTRELKHLYNEHEKNRIQEETSKKWQIQGLCRYCGGKLSAFKKICNNCGEKK